MITLGQALVSSGLQGVQRDTEAEVWQMVVFFPLSFYQF